MNGWHVLLVVYLGIGFAAGIIVTSGEAISYYRSISQIRRDEEQVGTFLWGIAVLIAAMFMVVAWPVAFMKDDDDGE